jgi:acyl-CoA thioester hydrolase
MRTVSTGFRVRYPEIDRMDVAHHSCFLVWFELGRTEWLRHSGLSYRQMELEHGVLFPVLEASLRITAPARYDDELTVETEAPRLDRLRVRFEYRIVRASDGRQIASGHTLHVAAGRDGRPRRLPAALFERLKAWSTA